MKHKHNFFEPGFDHMLISIYMLICLYISGADMEAQFVFKPNMLTPLNCAVCTCLEMEVPGEETIYIPCPRLCSRV
jgi:hypothetical protein